VCHCFARTAVDHRAVIQYLTTTCSRVDFDPDQVPAGEPHAE
jgi:hypothetical protein